MALQSLSFDHYIFTVHNAPSKIESTKGWAHNKSSIFLIYMNAIIIINTQKQIVMSSLDEIFMCKIY